jgi:hypothetical protein
VDVSLEEAAADSVAGARWSIRATKSCAFIFRGRRTGRRGRFMEGATWDIEKIEAQWRIVRSREHWIT